jgi:hypothetical protein
MKKITIIIAIIALSSSFWGCSEAWDKHYEEESESTLTLYDYLANEADYSSFFNLLKTSYINDTSTVANELSKDQYLTVWAVKNSNYDISGITMDMNVVGEYHVNYLSFGTANLTNGLRICTLSGVYITINQKDGENFANTSKIISTVRLKNGVIHEIESLMVPKVNLFNYICMLPDEYSIIRDSIIFYNEKEFDKENSIPTGVDETGNTIYDSVFITSNPLFDYADISSEFEEFTVFIPNNEVINNTLEKLKNQYALMGKTFGSSDSVLALDWIKKAIFHSGTITDYEATTDLTSVYSKIWRTTVQKVDENNPLEFSNGVVYNVTDMKIPNNVVITRIKSLVWYYSYLDSIEQASLYRFKGTTTVSIFTGDQYYSTGFYYLLLQTEGDTESNDEFSVEFPPIGLDTLADGSIDAYEMQVPCGEYNFYMGFKSSGHPYVDIYFQTGSDSITDESALVASEVNVSAATPWNYDRNNDVETYAGKAKWNGSGGLVGTVNVKGEGMSTFRIKVKFNKLLSASGSKKMQIYHWALKPTSNNY